MPDIETARLRLRPFTLGDADAYYLAVMCDPDVRRYLPGGQPLPREGAEPILGRFQDHWDRHGFGGWAVIYRAEDRLIGQCGLQYVPGTTEIEVFYALAKAYWGQGFAPEAAHAALRYGFETLHLDWIVAMFMPGNHVSERVMIKIGRPTRGSSTPTRQTCRSTPLPGPSSSPATRRIRCATRASNGHATYG